MTTCKLLLCVTGVPGLHLTVVAEAAEVEAKAVAQVCPAGAADHVPLHTLHLQAGGGVTIGWLQVRAGEREKGREEFC